VQFYDIFLLFAKHVDIFLNSKNTRVCATQGALYLFSCSLREFCKIQVLTADQFETDLTVLLIIIEKIGLL
jgi:hypothetical protein